MISNQKLFSVGNFDFRLQHLLVIGILALSVSISMLIRSQPILYGFELFEFDPFFNYRATEFVLENGHTSYFEWIDTKSWHPFGRNVSDTSQVTLHVITAALYQIFGNGMSLYDFTIIFPLIIGSITAVVVFAFVRVLSGTTAGLFAALIFSVSVPIFSRGLVGWFKSEPLGIFLAFLAIYLFVSGLKFNRGKISLIKLVAAGLFLSLGLSAWGGILFFVLPLAIYYISLPFFKSEKNFLIWATPVFTISFIGFSLIFERSLAFIIGYAGIILLLSTVFVIITEIIKKFSNEKTKIRNCIITLLSIISLGSIIPFTGLVNLPTFRYLNAVNPFLTSQDALTDSVAEHMTTSLSLSFTFLAVFLIFGFIGIWFIFSKKDINLKNDMKVFTLITALLGIYLSSAFVRLELFASVAIIMLSSIGLAYLSSKILQQKNQKPTKLIFLSIIVILFIIPVTLPENNNWIEWGDFSASILNGGSSYSQFSSNDWKHAMEWIKQNTPKNSVIASWWDYGYWITTLSDRTTLVDNSTLIDWQIKKMAYTLITTPEKSAKILGSHYTEDISPYLGEKNILAFGGDLESDFQNNYQKIHGKSCQQTFKLDSYQLEIPEESCNPVTKGMDADYVLIYLVGERFYIDGMEQPLYTLEGGGDESKKAWFAKISNHQVSQFIQSDNVTPTPYYMENSTLGKLTPFSIFKYVEPNTGRTFDEYYDGLIPVYVVDLKFPDPENDPFTLVYASPSLYNEQPGIMSAVFIYKINPDYN